MKKCKKIILWVLIFAAVTLLVLNLAVGLFGKKIVIEQVKENLNLPASLGGISVSFPFSINLSELRIGELARIRRIALSPSLLGFLAGKVVLNRLIVADPELTIVQSPDGQLNLPQLKTKTNQPPFLLAGLIIKNGKIKFIDKKVDFKGREIIVKNVDIKISKLSLPPTSLFTRYRLSADIADGAGKGLGRISGSGWIDFGPKDMDGNFQLKDLEATYFAPYLGEFFQDLLGQKNVLSAKLNFDADLKAKADDLKIACRLVLSDFIYSQEEAAEGTEAFPVSMSGILNVFRNKEGKVDLKFNVNTRLSQPRFNILQIATGAVKESLTAQPPEKTIENISHAVEQFKAIGKSLKDIWKNK